MENCDGLDFDRFRQRVEGGGDYDVADLRNLLRKDQNPDLSAIIRRVAGGFRFLSELTEREKTLTADPARLCRFRLAGLEDL